MTPPMSPSEFATTLRRIADAVERHLICPKLPPPGLDGELALGGILALQYLRKLITNANMQLDNAGFLVLLDALGHDVEVFPAGLWEIGDGIEEYVRQEQEGGTK